MAALGAFVAIVILTTVYAVNPPHDFYLTVTDIERATDILRERIQNTMAPAEGKASYKLYIAGFIRLAFHSCVGKQCVGCLNLNDSSNNGLQRSVEELESVHRNLTSERGPAFYISRGDLWALAAKVAFDVGVGNNDPSSTVRFRYGRKDCDTAPSTDEIVAFPNRRWGIDETLIYFETLGFNAIETVALLGFHTLGVVRDLGTDSVIAQWVVSPDVINNQFYKDLNSSNVNWTQVPKNYTNLNDSIYSWERNVAAPEPKRIMLNPDIALLRNFTATNKQTGEVSCTMDSCAVSSTASIVEEFAKDVTGLLAWRKAASNAYTKLIERGYETLQDPSPAPSPTATNRASFTDPAAMYYLVMAALITHWAFER